MKTSRPTDASTAIEFARQSKLKREWLWAQYLVVLLEDRRIGAGLNFAIVIYDKLAAEKEGEYFAESLIAAKKLCNSQDPAYCAEIDAMSEKIWFNPIDQTFSVRGISRILNAKSFLLKNRHKEYFVEVSRAIGMVIADPPSGLDFEDIATEFRRYEAHAGCSPKTDP